MSGKNQYFCSSNAFSHFFPETSNKDDVDLICAVIEQNVWKKFKLKKQLQEMLLCLSKLFIEKINKHTLCSIRGNKTPRIHFIALEKIRTAKGTQQIFNDIKNDTIYHKPCITWIVQKFHVFKNK